MLKKYFNTDFIALCILIIIVKIPSHTNPSMESHMLSVRVSPWHSFSGQSFQRKSNCILDFVNTVSEISWWEFLVNIYCARSTTSPQHHQFVIYICTKCSCRIFHHCQNSVGPLPLTGCWRCKNKIEHTVSEKKEFFCETSLSCLL